MLLRIYRMRAQRGKAAAFEAAAAALAQAIGACDGSGGVQVARATDDCYLFIEHWRDEAARSDAGKAVDKALFDALFAVLDGKPETIDADVLTAL